MKKLLYDVLVSSLIFGSSCNRYYYKPNAVNAPMFTDGGQFHIAGAGMTSHFQENSGGGNSYFFDMQAAYSPIKHLGIIGNYSTYAYRPDNVDFAAGHVDADAHLAEAGVGTYIVGGKGRAKMVADIYAGGGAGSIMSDVDMKVRRVFIQPGIAMRHPAVDVGFNLRISNVKYTDLDDNGRGQSYLLGQNLFDPQRNKRIDDGSYFFLEPAFTVRAGYKFIKAQLQWVLATELSNVRWNYNAGRFTVGLHFSLEDALQMARESR